MKFAKIYVMLKKATSRVLRRLYILRVSQMMRSGELNEQLTYDINHHASVRLAEIARQVGVQRYIFASSCSMYGAASQDDILDESADFNPVTAYAKSKVYVERDGEPDGRG